MINNNNYYITGHHQNSGRLREELSNAEAELAAFEALQVLTPAGHSQPQRRASAIGIVGALGGGGGSGVGSGGGGVGGSDGGGVGAGGAKQRRRGSVEIAHEATESIELATLEEVAQKVSDACARCKQVFEEEMNSVRFDRLGRFNSTRNIFDRETDKDDARRPANVKGVTSAKMRK